MYSRFLAISNKKRLVSFKCLQSDNILDFEAPCFKQDNYSIVATLWHVMLERFYGIGDKRKVMLPWGFTCRTVIFTNDIKAFVWFSNALCVAKFFVLLVLLVFLLFLWVKKTPRLFLMYRPLRNSSYPCDYVINLWRKFLRIVFIKSL